MIRINLFGQFSCSVDELPLGMPYKQCGWLLARLACELGPRHNRQRIASDIWPDADPVAAQVNLRKALHCLKSTFPPGVLQRDRTHIWLNSELVRTDLEDFRLLLQRQQANDLLGFRGKRLLEGIPLEWARQLRTELSQAVNQQSPNLVEGCVAELKDCLVQEQREPNIDRPLEPWDVVDTALTWYSQYAVCELADFLWGVRSVVLAAGPSRFLNSWQSLLGRHDVSERARGLILLFLGNAHLWSGRQRDAITLLSQSIAIFQEEKQSEMLDLALFVQCVAALQTLDYSVAERYIARIRSTVAKTNLRGLYQWNLMNLEGAAATFEGLDRLLGNSDASQKLQNSGNLALLYWDMGKKQAASRCVSEVHILRQEIHDKRLNMFSDQISSLGHRIQDQAHDALPVLEACISQCRTEKLSWPPLQVNASECLLD